MPDDELLRAANAGSLKTRAGLDKQVRRLLADRRSETLATRFWSQWLRLQDVDKVRPDGVTYPQWDSSLSASFRRETELFFDNLVREDRSVLEMLTADYTFLDERLARHYGFGAVTGTAFRKVQLPRVPSRHPHAGQHPPAHLGGRPHLARAARQVGDAGDARVAAAAARRPTCRRSRTPRAWPRAACSPCASAWRRIAPTRRARRATR